MRITRRYLGKIAKEMYNLLESREVRTISELEEKLLNKQIKIDDNTYILIDLRNLGDGRKAYSMAYIIGGAGVPIDARISQVFPYTQIIVKAEEPVKGYKLFSTDIFGNLIQNKTIMHASVKTVKYELEELIKS